MKIAVIDDSKPILTIFKHLLQSYDVKVYNNPLIAIKEVPEFEPDIIICDYVMFDMDGIEVLKKLRSLGLTSKMILITSLYTEDNSFLINKCADNGFILEYKPFFREKLQMLIGDLHENY